MPAELTLPHEAKELLSALLKYAKIKYLFWKCCCIEAFRIFPKNIFMVQRVAVGLSYNLLRLRETYNALQLPVIFFSFFYQLHQSLRNCKSVFLILKIWQYGRSRRWAQFFSRYSCKNWFDISISIRPIITKFEKQL